MSFGASVAPAMLGYREFGEEEARLLESVSLSRFRHSPMVSEGDHAGRSRL